MTALAVELQPIDWGAIEGAIFDWVVDKLALPENQVIFEDQNLPQPPYPYVSLKRTAGPTKEGGKDELRASTDLTQPAGQEIELLTAGLREFTLTTQVWVDPFSGANDPNGDAVKLASKLQASLGQLTVQERFRTVGVAIIEELAVTDTSLVVNAEFISRATLDVRLRVTSGITERTGFYDKTLIESTGLGIDLTVDAS